MLFKGFFLDNKNANSSDLHSFITKIKWCLLLIHFWKEIQMIKAKNWLQASSKLFKHIVWACSTLRVCKSNDGGICLLLQRITLNRWSHWSRHCCNQTRQKGKVRETPDLWPLHSSQQEENSEKTLKPDNLMKKIWALRCWMAFCLISRWATSMPPADWQCSGYKCFTSSSALLTWVNKLFSMWECLYQQSKRNIVFNLVWLMLNARWSTDELLRNTRSHVFK